MLSSLLEGQRGASDITAGHIFQIILDHRFRDVSKAYDSNRAVLTNYCEKFLGTVCLAIMILRCSAKRCILPKMKFEKYHLCSACEQGKIHRKHHKSKTDFASNKPLYLLHMDLCGPMRIESINGKRYVLVIVDDIHRHHTSSESFQEESSSSSLNADVQQSLEEVEVPSTNTQSILNNMVPNVASLSLSEASTSHNVFNECLEDAYFDASITFHDPSNVLTFYQPYPHEKKWTNDHPLHKIISDLKSSVRTRGQIANSCLFACFLSNIEHANIAEALKDADWVSAMQDKLDQFARLKVWRLVPRPKGKTIIKYQMDLQE
ncbi:hypothetical protein Tco_1555465 [Tanacetum coccineum]